MIETIIKFIVGLLRGLYAEYSRDKAHYDSGRKEAELENEKQAAEKIKAADGVKPDLSPDGLRNDPNATDY